MPPTPREQEPSPISQGYAWSVRVTSIALEMVLPSLGGVWLDAKLGTFILFTLLGAVLGMTTALWSLLKTAKQASMEGKRKGTPKSREDSASRESSFDDEPDGPGPRSAEKP